MTAGIPNTINEGFSSQPELFPPLHILGNPEVRDHQIDYPCALRGGRDICLCRIDWRKKIIQSQQTRSPLCSRPIEGQILVVIWRHSDNTMSFEWHYLIIIEHSNLFLVSLLRMCVSCVTITSVYLTVLTQSRPN